MFFIRRIAGDSMRPTLRPGQVIIFRRFGSFKPGRIVAATTDRREVVKRLIRLDDKVALLQADAPGGSDYFVPLKGLKGTLVFKF